LAKFNFKNCEQGTRGDDTGVKHESRTRTASPTTTTASPQQKKMNPVKYKSEQTFYENFDSSKDLVLILLNKILERL